MVNRRFLLNPLAAAMLAALSPVLHAADADVVQNQALTLDNTLVTAEEELKQAPGVSTITADDIAKQPPVNDLSDIIRRMPGVNLTGNSASGVRGNNRQIDIRGMGPENTLILIDGKPVISRNSVRYGRTGDRDTRGDTNWVPAEQVERVEVIRGPAAARYGNGAAGGVVNIITKPATQETHGSFSVYTDMPTHSDEGSTKRANFGLSGALTENLTYRLYGSMNKTDRDGSSINEGHQEAGEAAPSGNEGVRNKDISGRLSWKLNDQQSIDFDASYSRQGNIYAGDNQYNLDINANPKAKSASPWVGRETNKMYRQNFAITHNGDWDFGTSKFFVQYEHTRNRRLDEGLTGGVEGTIDSTDFSTSDLKDYLAHGEFNLPLEWGAPQMLTLGGEWNRQELDDPHSTSQALSSGSYWSGSTAADSVAGVASGTRNSKSAANIGSLFVEDNIQPWNGTTITPGVRMDDHSEFGVNWSPSLNLSQELTDELTFKAGIARAFKAPNLYQMNPNYLLLSSGNGCPIGSSGSCYIMGNDNLKPEISVNKELGLEFKRDGWIAGLTYFRNDYKNKIEAGTDIVGYSSGGNMILQWENAKRAVTQGVEGNLTIPMADNLTWTTNGTWMIEAKNKETGNVLSLIPKFTVNSMLDWQIDEQWSAQLNTTTYGRQKPPVQGTTKVDASGLNTDELGGYTLVGMNLGYQVTKNVRLGAGVNNIFDKRLFRKGNSNTAGAATYNQHGRAVYASLTTSF